jgi:hypothetical protein
VVGCWDQEIWLRLKPCGKLRFMQPVLEYSLAATRSVLEACDKFLSHHSLPRYTIYREGPPRNIPTRSQSLPRERFTF